jgi:hypothetical protein
MTMSLPDGEPEAGPWRAEPVSAVFGTLAEAGSPGGRPRVIAVDGRSSSGKTTLAGRLAACEAHTHVVHTDDIAWHHSMFGWADLLTEEILRPVRSGHAVSFRPPAWDTRGRPGTIDVPAGVSTVIVEGVGSARRELVDEFDASVWVQSDLPTMDRRNMARGGRRGAVAVRARAVDVGGDSIPRGTAVVESSNFDRGRYADDAARPGHRTRRRISRVAVMWHGSGENRHPAKSLAARGGGLPHVAPALRRPAGASCPWQTPQQVLEGIMGSTSSHQVAASRSPSDMRTAAVTADAYQTRPPPTH